MKRVRRRYTIALTAAPNGERAVINQKGPDSITSRLAGVMESSRFRMMRSKIFNEISELSSRKVVPSRNGDVLEDRCVCCASFGKLLRLSPTQKVLWR